MSDEVIKWENPYPEKNISVYEAHVRSRRDLMSSLWEMDRVKPTTVEHGVLVKLRKEQLGKLGNQIRAITFGTNSKVYGQS